MSEVKTESEKVEGAGKLSGLSLRISGTLRFSKKRTY
jgi:hypothetical protein